MSSARSRRPDSLYTPRTTWRAKPCSVSGGLSSVSSSTSMTSPISSTSTLTAPSLVRTTTFMGSWPSGRSCRPSRRRKSMADTICPRRLIMPLTTLGARGTRVIFWYWMTSCTCGTGVPKKCPSRKNVQNCCDEAMTCALLCWCWCWCWFWFWRWRLGEAGNCVAHHARHVQQVGDAFLNDGRAENSPALGGTLHHQFFVHDVHDAVHDQAHAAAGLGIHHHLHAGVPRRGGGIFARPRNDPGHAALLAALHQQKGLVVRRRFLFPAGLVFLLESGLAGLANHLGALRQTQDVQNEGHSSVAHDGCAGVSADPLQLFAQRLDDDLLGIGDLIDHQAKLATVGLHHHDVRGGVPGCLLPGLGYDLQFAVEIDQRQQASP